MFLFTVWLEIIGCLFSFPWVQLSYNADYRQWRSSLKSVVNTSHNLLLQQPFKLYHELNSLLSSHASVFTFFIVTAKLLKLNKTDIVWIFINEKVPRDLKLSQEAVDFLKSNDSLSYVDLQNDHSASVSC